MKLLRITCVGGSRLCKSNTSICLELLIYYYWKVIRYRRYASINVNLLSCRT